MSQKILLGFLFGLLLIGGWYIKLGGIYEVNTSENYNILEGDKKFEKTLYQEAGSYYQAALEIKVTRKTMDKLIASCEAFYKEMNDTKSRNQLLSALESACTYFENESIYWERRMELNIESEDYNAAYSICRNAQEIGIHSEKFKELKRKIIYSYSVVGSYRSDYRYDVNGYILVENGDSWSRLSGDGENESSEDYIQLGYVGDDSIFLCEKMNHQVCYMDLNGVKRGIVNLDISDFGLYSSGFCNVKYKNHYAFVDLDGNILADNFKKCGCFQNGNAPVQTQEGTWGLLQTDGTITEKDVEDIVVDSAGRYIVLDCVIACKNGIYQFFDSEIIKPLNDFSAVEMDILTSDKIVAYKNEKGMWGYVDMEGNVVIEPQYEAAKSFSNGLAAVCKNGKWGYVNRENVIVVDMEYNNCGYVSNGGICFVSNEERICQMIKFRFPNLIK